VHTCCVESLRDTRGRYNRVTSRKLVVLNESNTELKSLDEKTMRGLCLENCTLLAVTTYADYVCPPFPLSIGGPWTISSHLVYMHFIDIE
jgi:hypothetical protein